MIVFWIIAALMLGAAAAIVILPLTRSAVGAGPDRRDANLIVYRDRIAELAEEQRQGLLSTEAFGKERADLERALLDDAGQPVPAAAAARHERRAIVVTALLIPLATVSLYLWLGDVGVLSGEPAVSRPTASGEQHEVQEMVSRLERRLQDSPRDAEGWTLLGRSYAYLKRHADAAGAFGSAYRLQMNDAQRAADYAEALAVASGNRLQGESQQLIRRALELDPDNRKALWLAGVERLQSGDRAAAASFWMKLRKQFPVGSDDAQRLDGYIAQMQGAPAAESGSARAAQVAPPKSIAVNVALAPELAKTAGPDAIVFVFARAAEGPRMPLAIVRRRVRDLPFEVVLDDSQSMAPGMTISKFPRVIVGARISITGEAMPQSGDLEGVSGIVQAAAGAAVQVRIERVVR